MLIHIFNFSRCHKLPARFLVISAFIVAITAIRSNIYRCFTQQFRYSFLCFYSALTTTTEPKYRTVIVDNLCFFTLVQIFQLAHRLQYWYHTYISRSDNAHELRTICWSCTGIKFIKP